MASSEYLDNLPARRVVNPVNGKSAFKVGTRGLRIVEELSARGCSTVTIAKALRMSRDAFLACRRRQPEVEEAMERGRAVEHDALVSNLRTLADGGNVVANLFLLKTRHGYREGEPPEVNLTVHTGGVLVVPARQTVEEYLEAKRAAGEIDPEPPMRDVTPGLRHYTPPEPIEYMAEAPTPSSRPDATPDKADRHPTGTRLGRTSTRGD